MSPDEAAQHVLDTQGASKGEVTRRTFMKAIALGLVAMGWRPYVPGLLPSDTTVPMMSPQEAEPPLDEVYDTVFGMTMAVSPTGHTGDNLKRYVEELLTKRWKEGLNKLVASGQYDLVRPLNDAVYIHAPAGHDGDDPLAQHELLGVKQHWLVIRRADIP